MMAQDGLEDILGLPLHHTVLKLKGTYLVGPKRCLS